MSGEATWESARSRDDGAVGHARVRRTAPNASGGRNPGAMAAMQGIARRAPAKAALAVFPNQ